MHSLLISNQEEIRELTVEEASLVGGGFAGLSTPNQSQDWEGWLDPSSSMIRSVGLGLNGYDEFENKSKTVGTFDWKSTYTYDDRNRPVTNMDREKVD
jgi:hypothetical protein